jgi:hypothetical protein
MSNNNPKEPLIKGISQYEVDFVIPRIGIDLPLGIDPFLLFKSHDPAYRSLHELILTAFNAGVEAVRRDDATAAERIFDFPEVSAIGLGYTVRSKRGSGVGSHLRRLILDTLSNSPALLERGVRHIEEMQLLSAGVGPDRISDIGANVIKKFLIEYTQRQCEIWNLPLTAGVPIAHVYNPATHSWYDTYENLPTSPLDDSPILFVPRRIVRVLPWINYDDFVKTEFNAYLQARRDRVRRSEAKEEGNAKEKVVIVARRDISLVERYVRLREQQAAGAQPALDYVDEDVCKEAEALKTRLDAIRSGLESAAEYQKLILEILNYLFNPELIDGEPEVRTVEGTERRDLIFTNDSDESFWSYIRSEHSGIVVMFEAKNKNALEIADINQTAVYMGDRIGRFAVIVTRQTPTGAIQRKIFSIWNDSVPNRKIILTLSDDQLHELLDLRCQGRSPTKWMQKHYRSFRTAVQ